MVALVVETLLGFLTFTGSLMAMGKLQEILPLAPDHLPEPEPDQPRAVRHRASALGVRADPGPHRHLALSRSSPAWRCCSASC